MPYASEIANCICSTPLDNKSVLPRSISTSTKEFAENYYAAPTFHSSQTYSQLEDEQIFDVSLSAVELSSEWKSMETEERHFLNWLDNFDNSKVYTISGNSGTGKSTYLNYLKFCEKKAHNWIILDVSLATKRITWYEDKSTYISDYKPASQKVFSIILREIKKVFFPKYSENKADMIFTNIYSIMRNYSQAYKNELIASHVLFDRILKKIKSFRIETTSREKNKIIAGCFESYFGNSGGQNSTEKIYMALDVLVYALCCQNIQKNNHIIVFDNIERFIKMDELFNIEIDNLRRDLANYILELKERDFYSNHFKIIMAIRCSTARMCGVQLHSADEQPSNLDLSSWFNIEDIMDAHMRFCEDNNIDVEGYSLLRQIAGDKRKCKDNTIRGLQILLSPLFNYNKRLIIDFLGIIIENIDNREKYPYGEMLQHYVRLWDQDTSLSRCGARNIIRGIVLNKLKHSDNLFVHLKMLRTMKYEKGEIGLDLSRRFLTHLYNLTVADSKDDVPLKNVLCIMYNTNDSFKMWNDDSSRRRAISEILFYMNSYNRRTNDWIQFVDIQVSKEFQTITIDSVDNLEETITQKFEQIHISLMPSGIVYLKHIITSFEYFAVLYCNNYKPLYSLIPTQEELAGTKSLNKLECIKIIINVIDATNSYIKNIRANALTIKDQTGKNESFSEQLVAAHYAYITNFANYIMSLHVPPSLGVSVESAYSYQDLAYYIQSLRNNYIKSGKK